MALQNEIKQAQIQNEIYNLSGQISALSSGKPEDIQKAEFLSGKQFIPEVDPITEYLENRKNKPLVEIKKEIADLKPIISRIEALPTQPNVPAIENPQLLRVNVNLTDAEMKLLKEQGFNPDIIYNEDVFNQNYEKEMAEIGKNNSKLNGRRSGLKKNDKKRADLTEKIEANKKYREVLQARQSVKVGRGLDKPCPILDQMTERAKVLIGELNAGNSSLDLRNELSRLLLHLYKNNVISKSEYRSFSSL